MAELYLETSFISACVTNRRDVLSRYRQRVNREWWGTQRGRYEVFISAEVLRELSHPTYPRRREAMGFVKGIPLLSVSAEAQGLARVLVRERVMPGPVAGDALHVAIATVHGMDYVVSWNVRHLANPNKTQHLRAICLRVGMVAPSVVTPESLWESENE